MDNKETLIHLMDFPFVLVIQHLLGCCILGETSQRRSAPITKFNQPKAWISLKRTSVAPQSKLFFVSPFFILIIFISIIQFLVMLFSLLLWLHHHCHLEKLLPQFWNVKLGLFGYYFSFRSNWTFRQVKENYKKLESFGIVKIIQSYQSWTIAKIIERSESFWTSKIVKL